MSSDSQVTGNTNLQKQDLATLVSLAGVAHKDRSSGNTFRDRATPVRPVW